MTQINAQRVPPCVVAAKIRGMPKGVAVTFGDLASRGFASQSGALPLFLIAMLAMTPRLCSAADLDRGEQLARQWCASCHLLPGAAQPSVPQGPPSFRDIAHSGKTAEQLKLFLVRPHGSMPPLTLSRVEIDALVGYIESLR